jgi:hypothetical protein
MEVDPAKGVGGLLGGEGRGEQGREDAGEEQNRDGPHGFRYSRVAFGGDFFGILRALDVCFYAHIYLAKSGSGAPKRLRL